MANDETGANLKLSTLPEKNLMLVRVELSEGTTVTVAVNRQRAGQLRTFIDQWLAEPAAPKPDPEDYSADHPEHASNINA